jgi:hypothetical protein
MSTHTLSQLLPAGGGGSDYLFSCKHRALVIKFPIIGAQQWCALMEEQSSGGEDEASM